VRGLLAQRIDLALDDAGLIDPSRDAVELAGPQVDQLGEGALRRRLGLGQCQRRACQHQQQAGETEETPHGLWYHVGPLINVVYPPNSDEWRRLTDGARPADLRLVDSFGRPGYGAPRIDSFSGVFAMADGQGVGEVRVAPDRLHAFTMAICRADGSSEQEARLVADHLVLANLFGH